MVALEKLWRHGVGVARATGVVFLLVAVLAPANPSLLPALHAPPVMVHDTGDRSSMEMGVEG